jgi:preprotein translocase subunit SecG
MFNTLVILLMIIAVLLILVVLIQNPKGGGLSSEFGGSSSSQMFGVQKTGDILEQLTWGFAATIIVLSLVSKFFWTSTASGVSSVNVEKAANKVVPTAPAPSSAPAPAPAAAPATAPKPAGK